MRYQIITVGSELTLGLSVDTNAAFISKALGKHGFTCVRHVSVPDKIDLIAEAIRESLAQADGVIITGGLGPTIDDLTRDAISQALGRELEYQERLAHIIEERYGNRAIPLPEITYRQAYLPKGAEAIIPTIGSAPGIIINEDERFLFSLPGVPREMADMLEKNIVPWLETRFCCGVAHAVRVLRTTAKSEASLQESIEDLVRSLQDVDIGILAYPGEIQLQLLAKGADMDEAKAIVGNAETLLRERLGNIVYGCDDETLEEVIGKLLLKYDLSLAVAESCTGGLVGKKLTDIAGSSEYFRGGIIAYNNDAKKSLLNVSSQTLVRHGAVSAATALAMAFGVRDRFNADVGLSITGIAGPDGGTEEKPVGLVYIALSHQVTNYSNRFVFFGSRDTVRIKSANAALDMLRYYILDNFERAGGDAS
ncbi:MAG: competence/damage-inducible protein A [Candidatus Aquicultor sp.]|nr:competence/damage-inducible protein A [Candidatus Aquicultor sp.]